MLLSKSAQSFHISALLNIKEKAYTDSQSFQGMVGTETNILLLIFMKIDPAVLKIWPFLHLKIAENDGCHFVYLVT